jgi:hypothetical protein
MCARRIAPVPIAASIQYPKTGERSDRGRRPERGGGVEPLHAQSLAKDDAAGQKADSRNHLRRDARTSAMSIRSA